MFTKKKKTKQMSQGNPLPSGSEFAPHETEKPTAGPTFEAGDRAGRKAPTRPVTQMREGSAGEERSYSRGRQVLLVVLPILACLLIGILIWLLVRMPRARDIRMERNMVPLPSQKATQPRETKIVPSAKASRSAAEQAAPRQTRVITRQMVSQLIRTGAGLPPTSNGTAELSADRPDLVWKSPVAVGQAESPVSEEASQPAEATLPSEAELLDQEVPTEEPAAEGEPEGEIPAEEEYAEVPVEEVPLTEEPVVEEPVVEEPVVEEPPVDVAPAEELPVVSDFWDSNMSAYVYGDQVNLRAEDSMESEVIRTVYAGDLLYEVSTNNVWSYVVLEDGMEGYIYSNLLSYNYVPSAEEEALAAQADQPVYTAEEFSPYEGRLWSLFSGVNIRLEPSLDGEIVGSLLYGDYCDAIAYTGGWFQILWNDGQVAYVHGDYLTEEEIVVAETDDEREIVHEEVQYVAPDLPDSPADLAGGSAVASLALQYVGYPYVYGASGPNSFDCSGFAQYIYSQLGVTIGRSTYDQVNNGIAVGFGYKDYSNLVPGDLVLFGEGQNVYHVGIYIGNGQMVHAGNSSTGVVVDSLNLDYWADRIASVRRVLY